MAVMPAAIFDIINTLINLIHNKVCFIFIYRFFKGSVFHELYLKRSLNMMERWLSKTKYLCGDQMTIADISAACELD